jgi:Ni/Co efflux regulator RcnB
MRKAILGILMAATAGMPVAAQAQDTDRTDGRSGRAAARAERSADHYREQGERNQARTEQREQRQEVRVQRQERVEAPVRVQQQQQQQSQQSWAGRRGAVEGQRGQRWGGGYDSSSNRDAYRQRVDQTRAANRSSIEQSIGGNYARQGQRNQERTEQQLRREYGVGQRNGDWNRDRDGRGDRYGDRRDGRGSSSWNRGWRNDSRYDWQRYRYSNRDRFRMGNYYSPYRGYGYNRLSIGLVLDSLFYSNRYWLNDPYQYRLPAAPYGTQWVRYYNDVVLVDVYTGEVIDVIENFFW